MTITKSKQSICILCINIYILLLLSSCSSNDKNEVALSYHLEEKDGIAIEFYTPENYTKEIRNEREATAFFNDKNIILWDDVIIYFSSEESRSYMSLYVDETSKGTLQHSDKSGLYETELSYIKSMFYDKKDWDVRLPLIFRGVDNKGNPYYYIMQFTRYNRSDTTWRNNPMIDDNTLPMDSVEIDCFYYSIVDKKVVLLEIYMLESFYNFSFMNVLTLLQSIKVYSRRD